MEENQQFETTTNLYSIEHLLDYLWMRYEGEQKLFKPKNSKDFQSEYLYGDLLTGTQVNRQYHLLDKKGKEQLFSARKEYKVDLVGFRVLDEKKNEISIGVALLIYPPEKKEYSLFLLDEDQKVYRFLLSCQQKKGNHQIFDTLLIK